MARLRSHRARVELVSEGDKPDAIRVFHEGWGGRYRSLEDGRRQMVALFLPGDICELDVLLAAQMDHSISTLTPATVGEIDKSGHDVLMAAHPRVQQALAWERLVSFSIQREWALNLGQRTAFERVGHLLCEIFLRLQIVGHAEPDTCEMPLTQTDLAEATGLSTVHVNRTLQELRARELIVLRDRTLSIPDFERLAQEATFDPTYLHFEREGRHLDANA